MVENLTVPEMEAMAMRSPERACARASVQPHSSPYMDSMLGVIVSTSIDRFQSQS